MTAADREAQAKKLLALTEEMKGLATAGDWPVLAQREAERQEVARDLFATPVPREAAATVADCVRQVLDIDQDLLTLIEQKREQAAQALKDSRVGQKALDAYRRFSR